MGDKNLSYLDLATDQGLALEYEAVSDSRDLVMTAIRKDNEWKMGYGNCSASYNEGDILGLLIRTTVLINGTVNTTWRGGSPEHLFETITFKNATRAGVYGRNGFRQLPVLEEIWPREDPMPTNSQSHSFTDTESNEVSEKITNTVSDKVPDEIGNKVANEAY